MSQQFLPKTNSSLKQDCIAISLFCCLLFFSRHLAFEKITTHFLGGSTHDAGLYVWLMKHNWRDLWQLSWFDTRAFYPYGYSLAWSDNFILPSLLALPFVSIGASEVLAYNLILFIAQLLNGFFSYKVSSKLGASTPSAIGAGAAIMLLGILTWNLGHPQLQFIFFAPLAILAFLKFLSSRNFASSILSGICVFLCFLTTVYYSIFCSLALLFFIALIYLLRPKALKTKDLLNLTSASLIALLILIPFALPYFSVREAFGAKKLYESFYFAANFLSYFSASPENRLYANSLSISHAEAHLFAGFILIAITASAFLRTFLIPNFKKYVASFIFCFLTMCFFSIPAFRNPLLCIFFQYLTFGIFLLMTYKLGSAERSKGANFLTNRSISACLLGLSLFFFILSFGPIANPEKGESAYGIFSLFYNFYPGFNSIRAVGRFGIFSLIFALLLASLEISRLFQKKGFLGVLITSIIFLAIIMENWTPHYPLEEMERKPSVYHYLEENAAIDDTLVSIPLTEELKHGALVKSWGNFAKHNVSTMLLSFDSKLNTVNGYSGLRTKVMKDWPRKMDAFPDERSLTTLSTISGLKWLIYNSNANEDFNKEQFLRKVAFYKDSISFKFSDEDGFYLFELHHANDLSKPFFLVTPNKSGALAFELQSPKNSNLSEAVIDIFVEDQNGKEQIAFASTNTDGVWKEFAIHISSNGNKVKPLKFGFTPRANSPKIYLRNPRFLKN